MTNVRQFSIDGQRIEYAYESHETDGFERAVVCVHGITRNRHDFSYLSNRLRGTLNVYAPDLLGHGDSEWLDPSMVYEKEMFLAQLEDLMSSVRGRRIGFVGSSYGGLMGIRLAAEPSSPIACLVLNDAGVGVSQTFYEQTAKMIRMYPTFGSRRSVVGWMKLVMQNGGSLSEERFEEVVERSVQRTESGDYVLRYDRELPRVWLGNHNRRPESWSLWEAIRCPVLVVRGAGSSVLTRAVIDEMRARKPEIDLLEVEGAGHFPHLMEAVQTEPIEEWLSAHL